MKKILALTLSGLLILGGSGIAFTANATSDNSPAQQSNETATEQCNLYLVPGTYVLGGETIKNTISSGATELTEEQCEEIFTDNAYVCTLSEGESIPVPKTERQDKEGNAYAFNGWWTIVDATVTYFDKVPALTETTFLYADWRADLSQRKDPIIPEGVVEIEPDHYMMIKRASGETERITLRKQFTSSMSALTLGYKYPVELCAYGFELNPGDVITVYTTGLNDSEKAVVSPILSSNNTRTIDLESSGDGSNSTSDYLSADPGSQRKSPTITYIAETTGAFNIYIKYYTDGSFMAVYMEPTA